MGWGRATARSYVSRGGKTALASLAPTLPSPAYDAGEGSERDAAQGSFGRSFHPARPRTASITSWWRQPSAIVR